LRWLVINQENGAILRCQKSVEADFRERLHDLFPWPSQCICVATSRQAPGGFVLAG
jgi:hypothetical protein